MERCRKYSIFGDISDQTVSIVGGERCAVCSDGKYYNYTAKACLEAPIGMAAAKYVTYFYSDHPSYPPATSPQPNRVEKWGTGWKTGCSGSGTCTSQYVLHFEKLVSGVQIVFHLFILFISQRLAFAWRLYGLWNQL